MLRWLARAGLLALGVASAADIGSARAQGSATPQAAMISRGKYLVNMGDCHSCHDGPGKPLAGNYALNTPFGIMYTPNITPDKRTGIGDLTDDQFYHIFHDGRGPHGQFIYPGFPYPWFTRVTRDDVMAIHAYLMSLPPVYSPKMHDKLDFPLSIRPVVFFWNLLFFHPNTFKPIPGQSAQVNRGAYIAEGLEHCGDCHTPKNIAQAPMKSMRYAGGVFDKWYAPDITSDQREGIGGWSDADLFSFLKYGVDAKHGVALGPMRETIDYSLSKLTDSDLHDLVAYLKTVPPKTRYQPSQPVLNSTSRPGADVYATFCQECHQEDGHGLAGRVPALAGNGAVLANGPQDVIRAVLGGIRAQANYGPMPGFGTVLTDQQIADVTNYVRGAFGNTAPTTATPNEVSSAASETKNLLAGTQPCPPLGNTDIDHVIQDPSSGIQPILQQTDEDNLLQSVEKVVAILHAKAPQGQRADEVNEMTDAYCPVVEARPALQPIQRWQELDEFGERLYTELASGNKV
jgi:mono/diheme cytochrome c family protein